MYNYIAYCFNIISNYKLENMTVGKYNPNFIDIQLNINCITGFVNSEKTGITKNDNTYCVSYNDLVYYIFFKEFRISVITRTLDRVVRTISNIPMSILALENSYFLLHCSSVLINNKLYAFMGDKGVGKSTIAYKLINLRGATPFSDDAILQTPRGVYSRGNVFKVAKKDYGDNEEMFKRFVPYFFDDITGKIYLEYCDDRQRQSYYSQINTIFWLQRSADNSYRQESVNNESEKTIMILNNLVGSKRINRYFAIYILDNLVGRIFHKTKVEILYVPAEKCTDKKVLSVNVD